MSPCGDPHRSAAGDAVVSTADDFARTFSVSRETVEKLQIYEAKLRKWQPAVNLVSPKTLDQVWHRHFADSAQLAGFISEATRSVLDLGSGAGFPGLVLAILLQERSSPPSVTLIESDTRKAAFLSDVARSVDNPARILSTRIEASSTVKDVGLVDCVTARALAPCIRLFASFALFAHPGTVGVFPKGRGYADELQAAREHWDFKVAHHPSLTDADSRIVVVSNVTTRDATARQEGPNAHDDTR